MTCEYEHNAIKPSVPNQNINLEVLDSLACNNSSTTKFITFLEPPTLRSSKTLTPQNSLCNFKAIKMLSTSLHAWAHYLLEINRTRDENAQARTHTQRHMNNACSEIVSCSLCFAFHCSSSILWFNQTIRDNTYLSSK